MIAGLVLAAGASRRMGASKLLLPWGERTILGSVVEALRLGGLGPILVVVGVEGEAIAAALRDTGATIVVNSDPSNGDMLRSIQIGLRAMPEGIEAAAIMPGDLPGVRPATVAAILEARRQGAAGIVAPLRAGRRGHPVLLPRGIWAEVLALGPEASLRSYLRDHLSEITTVEVDDPGIHHDIDTPADYAESKAGGGE